MNLRISTAPHIREGNTTRSLMTHVLIAMVPCAIAGVYRFGYNAAILLVVAMVTAVLAEFLWQKITKRPVRVDDYSALVTGLLLGLNLPPDAPWWLAMVGSALAILLVKQIFGGLGDNFMNPALAARAILLASWPVHMTRFILPLNQLIPTVDAVATATPLSTKSADIWNLFMGNIPGTLGEVSKMMILLGLLYLLLTKVISWRIPVIMIGSAALVSWLLGESPLYTVLSGGLLFGAVFMATDYTTTPMTAKGQMVFAAGCGLIVAIIRKFGSYPEGVTYAILLMNIATPLIDKFMRPRLYGQPKKEKAAKEVKANA